jgi:tetratricopeptide (TPR) repeat protein
MRNYPSFFLLKSKQNNENPDELRKKAYQKFSSGNFEEAKSLYHKVIKLYENDHRNVAVILFDLGSLCSINGNHEEAINYYKQSLSSFKKDRFSLYDQAKVNLKIASCYCENNQSDQAPSYINEALQIIEQPSFVNNERNLVNIFKDVGNLYLKMNFDDKGIDYLKKSIKNSYKILSKEKSRRIGIFDAPTSQDLNNFVSNSINFVKILQKNHIHSLGHKEYYEDLLSDFEDLSEFCNKSEIVKDISSYPREKEVFFEIYKKLLLFIDGDIGNPPPKVEPRLEKLFTIIDGEMRRTPDKRDLQFTSSSISRQIARLAGSLQSLITQDSERIISPRSLYDTGAGVYIDTGAENSTMDQSSSKSRDESPPRSSPSSTLKKEDSVIRAEGSVAFLER